MTAVRCRLQSDNVLGHYFGNSFAENHQAAIRDAQEAERSTGRALWGSSRPTIRDVVATTLAAPDPFAPEFGPGVRYATWKE